MVRFLFHHVCTCYLDCTSNRRWLYQVVATGTTALRIAGIEEAGPYTTTGVVVGHPTTATIDTTTTTPPGPAVAEIETAVVVAAAATTTTGSIMSTSIGLAVVVKVILLYMEQRRPTPSL